MAVSLPKHFEEFAEARKKGFLKMKELKDRGEKVCGSFCQYTPAEIIMAAGLYQVGLCGRSNDPIKTAETRLPANLCPLIKASFGHLLEESCPYAFFSDVVIGETTCDGKKKMFELMGEYKSMHVIHLPNLPDYERSLEYWQMELEKLAHELEQEFDVEITEDKLNQAIHWCNLERTQLAHLYELGKYEPPAITGKEMCEITSGAEFMFNREEKFNKINEVLIQSEKNRLEGKLPYGPDPLRPRIIISGAGLGGVHDKTVYVVEELGGSVVCFEGCGGISSRRRLVDEDTTRNPYRRLAEKYIEVPCAIVSPNTRRMQQVRDTIKEWNADGLISITLHSCNPFAIETENIRRVCEECGIPLLHIETDFTPGDEGQIRTRLEAFLEMIREKKRVKNEQAAVAGSN